ncbi:MAG: thioredoxin [Clostridia bacterium]|nr:thioredoxin [Clostridia bacterium]
MSEIAITKQNFEEEVLNSDIPVIVDFWAVWCGPCQMLAPVIAELSEELSGKVKVGKVNVDEEQELALRFGVASIPTVMLFENGRAVKISVGFMDKQKLKDTLGI